MGHTECPQCHERKLPHRVCPKCGYYYSGPKDKKTGREIVEVSE
jgi:large subunit ribosomal protein L32